jgi:hypothetical protein
MKKSIIIFALISILFSCSESEKPMDEKSIKEKELNEKLIGKWKNVSMTIQMNTYRNSDTTAYYVVKEGNWEKELNIKPIITTLDKDGKYTSEYFTIHGEKFREVTGTWSVKNDSMIFIESGMRTAYQAKIVDSLARFRAIIDWDRDGENDDLYEGIQIKID